MTSEERSALLRVEQILTEKDAKGRTFIDKIDHIDEWLFSDADGSKVPRATQLDSVLFARVVTRWGFRALLAIAAAIITIGTAWDNLKSLITGD